MSSSGVPIEAVSIPLAGVVGLFVGSFLNVVVYRVPIGLSVSTPRSFCPNCDRQLAWWENVPVVSWLALQRRCHTCHQSISARYPLVELSTGTIFSLVTWAWHGTWVSAGYCVLAATAMAILLIELGGSRAPLSVAALGTLLGEAVIVSVAAWLQRWAVLGGSLAGLATGVVVFGILRARDPDCLDPREHGRSALLIAGCWLGGLGLVAVVGGVATGVLVTFTCLVGVWLTARPSKGAGPTGTRHLHPLLATPLVTAIAAAMVVSLIVAG